MPQALPMLVYYGAAAGGATAGWAAFASFVVSAVVADYQKQSAADKARAQAARDRTVNIRSGVAPRKLVLGTARLGGAVMYGEFVGEYQEYLDMITALHHGSAGPLTEVLGAYLDDEFVPAADLVSGVPTTGKYSGADVLASRFEAVIAATLGATSVTLPSLPSNPTDVQVILQIGTGDASTQAAVAVASVVGLVVTFVDPLVADGDVHVMYSTDANPYVPLRLQWTTGTDSQASTTWDGVDTPKWTADHRLRGVSYLRSLMRTEDRVFATGTPTVSLVARAADGVWDPRSETYVNGTSNPALLSAWFRMLAKRDGGFGVPTEWIDWDTVATAANICDELLSVKKLDGSGYEDVKRYECNTVLNLELPAADNLRVILGAMAGDFPFTGGAYRCYAGAFRAAALTLTDDDVSGEDPITFAPSTGAASPPNVITARIYNRAKAWVEDAAPAVVNDTYVTADGAEESMEIDLPACTDTRQANYLMGVRLEQMRPAMAGSLTVKGVGANVALLDTVQLDLVGYEALAGKTFEVRRRTNHWNGRYTLELTEVKASTFALDADRFVPPGTDDPGDTSDLWNVTPVEITSVANATLIQTDGSHLDRALVVWAAHPQSLVNPHGYIEVRYRAPDTEWVHTTPVPGEQTKTYIGPLGVGQVLFIEARARNSLGVVSAWSGTDPFVVTGTNDVPPDVSGFTGVIKPGQVVFSWVDVTKLETELRVGATWAGAVFGWAGVASDYKLARPANGTYTVWAAHRRNGIYSATPVSVVVVVDDSIDGGGGGALVLEIDGPPIFRFADGATHTTADPDLTLTARLISLFGEADWEARAFDAMTGGTDLGAVTLTGTGNARVLTGANFVAAGTSGSVRRVDVTASIGAAFDVQTIFRYDPTVTEPFLYLANPIAVVSTDEAGNYGDYSRAKTPAAVLDTGADVTSTWTLSIEPDAGLTSTINGGAGPVTGTGSVEVAVSASTLPDGVVLIRASKSGETDLTAPFRLVKRPAQGVERLLYFAPRTDIVLPTDSAGNPTSFTNAWTKALVRLKSGLDATDQYTFSKVDEGVVSELTDNTIRITAWVALGLFGTTVSVTPGVGSTGWERPAPLVIRGPDAWIQCGLNTNIYAPFSVARRSVDYETWVDVALGVTEHWSLGAATGGNIVLGNNSNSNQVLRSTDGGLTYSPVTLPVTNAYQHMRGQAGTFIFLPNGHTTGLRSTDGGASFSAITVPSGPFDLFGVGINKWLFKNSSSGYSISLDNGTSWAATSPPAAIKSAIGFLGLIVAAYSGASSQVAYSEDNGTTWANATLPYSCTDGRLLNVKGVLYLYGSAKVQYSLDGRRWQGSGATVTSSDCWLISADELDIDVLPLLNNLSGIWAKMPMTATSAQEGAVHVTAHTPGEDDLTATLPVQLGAIVPPVRVSNINPAFLQIPATSDGVPTNMDNAVLEVTVVESSLTVTSDYAWAWTATHLTPSSGTGAVATLTDMDVAEDRGRVSFVGTAAGKDTVILGADVVKLKGPDTSGISIGASYNPTAVSNTYLGLRLTSAGAVEVKEGSGGSWIPVGQWHNPMGAGVGAGAWVRFDLLEALDAYSTLTATTGTFLALTSDRSVVLESTTTGLHVAKVVVYLSPNSGGTLAQASLVTMLLTCP